MKKLLILVTSCSLLGIMSCNDKKDSATTSTETKSVDDGMKTSDKAKLDAFNTVSDAFQTGDVSKIDGVVAEDFLDHGDMKDVKGRDSLKAMILAMHAKMKDAKSQTINQVVSGDYVYSWMRYTGTSDGSMGMPAGPYDMSAIELVKFNGENKATEHWAFMEMREMMKMMPAPAAKK
jgi:predicted SnoaL-like aldol condensation-catalyzing enzyme